ADVFVMRLAVACRSLRKAVAQSGTTQLGGPWIQGPGTWQPAGLFQALGLEGLERLCLPAVTLMCEVAFKNTGEVLAFLDAARGLAADADDGHVFFSNFRFKVRDVEFMFSGYDDGDDCRCEAEPSIDMFVGDVHIQASLEALCNEEDPTGPPLFNLSVFQDPMPAIAETCVEMLGSSLLLPDLRLVSYDGCICSDHGLDSTSPLLLHMRKGNPLPMFLAFRIAAGDVH
ncbi:aglC, partial [Symbiodinium pilosum]